MKNHLLAALALALLLTGCGGVPQEEDRREGQYGVCFLNRETGELEREWAGLEEDTDPVEGLLTLLWRGPQALEHVSPIPAGTRVRSWKLEEGLLTIDLSELYGGLSEIALTQADSCIVLTLCQLEEVERVYLTMEGRARPFRDKVYTADDFLLQSGAPPAGETELRLWFPGAGGLEEESRSVQLGAGDQPEVAALLALLEGPESMELRPVAPEETVLLGLGRRGDRLTVDLSGQWLEGEEDPQRLWAVAQTLWELEPGAGIAFRVEGQPLTAFAGVELGEPLRLAEKE